MSVVSVLIIDDHEVFAEGLAMILRSAPDLECVGIATTAAEAIELTRTHRPDVVLLDHHLPDRKGASIVREVASAGGSAVVILTSETSDDVLLASFEAGAVGYLLKTRAARQVLDAVRAAASGETLISASTLARLLRRREDVDASRQTAQLTEREMQVLRVMAEGCTTAEMSERLGVTVSSARTYVQTVLEKLDARSRLQAVVRAKRAGLLGD